MSCGTTTERLPHRYDLQELQHWYDQAEENAGQKSEALDLGGIKVLPKLRWRWLINKTTSTALVDQQDDLQKEL